MLNNSKLGLLLQPYSLLFIIFFYDMLFLHPFCIILHQYIIKACNFIKTLKSEHMKTSWLTIILFSLILSLSAQNKTTEVRVKIKQNDKTILDTTFRAPNEKAAKTIEKIVSKYSDEKIYINTENIHSLYVFDISKPVKSQSNDVTINLDSLLNDFSKKLEQKLEDWEVEAALDTLEVHAKELRENMREYKKTVDPELQEFKKELKEMVDKMRATRIIIIEDGDTIRIPNK